MTETLEQYRRAEHLCLRCGRYDDWTEAGHRLCWRCMAQEARLRDERRAAGLCTVCGKAPARAGRLTCKKCAAKMRIAQREAYRSKGKCEYAEGLEDLGEYACLHCPRPNSCIYDNEVK